MIYQEPTLFFDLSIAENIFMGRQPVDRVGRIQYDAMHREVRDLLASLGVDLRADQLVRGLSIADQQVIEIAKALSLNANVLIMDEPTAALSLPEVERLFTIVRRLRERDVAILFITHRLDEVFALTQRVTIMRDGAKVFDAPTSELDTASIVAKMVGRDLESFYPKADVTPGDVRLSVRGLTRTGVFKDVSFEVRAGEIVALAGLVGAGRSELMRLLYGADAARGGEVLLDGQAVKLGAPADAIAAGIVLCPEDHPLSGLDEIPTAALATESLLTREQASDFDQALERICITAGIAPKPRHRCSGEDQIRQMVAAGLGIALSAEHGASGAGIVARPLADPAARRDIVLAAVAGRQHSPALAAFLKLMRARDWRRQETLQVSKP